MDEIILAYLERLGVSNPSGKAELLSRYTDEIMLFNPKLSLVGKNERKSIIIDHVLDSVAAYPVFKRLMEGGQTLADLGSGAGLPGIPLAVLFDTNSVFLIERMRRRAGFLIGVSASLGLGNISVVEEDYKDLDGNYDVITCRAFHPLKDVLRVAMSLLSPRGTLVFYKGKRSAVMAEIEEVKEMGYSFEYSITPLEAPGDKERSFLVIDRWRKDA